MEKRLLLLFLFLSSIQVFSQAYLPDTAFLPPILRRVGKVTTFCRQTDGKIIVAGTFDYINNIPRKDIIRLYPDGSLDTSFELQASLTDEVSRLVVQTDGKVLATGAFTWVNTDTVNHIIRLNADGSVDQTFNVGSGFDTNVTDLALQPNGKIILAGPFSHYKGIAVGNLLRLNPDGEIDTAFQPVTISNPLQFPASIYRVRLLTDGRLVVSGNFTVLNGLPRKHLARLLADGSIDPDFVPANTNLVANTMEVDKDNNVILGGYYSSYSGPTPCGVIRLLADGSLDPNFQTNTIRQYDYVLNLTVQSDGKIVVSTLYEFWKDFIYRGRLVRFNTDGSLDSNFIYPTNQDSYADRMLALPDDQLLLLGSFIPYKASLLQLNADGSLGQNLSPAVERSYGANIIANLPNHQLLVGDGITSANSKPAGSLFRLSWQGILDPSYTPKVNISFLAVQPDGKVLGQEVQTVKLIRLNTDGSRDTSFESGSWGISSSMSVAVQQDGKIVVGRIYGSGTNTIVRLNADGSLDNSFNPGTFTTGISKVLLQPDGKILASTEENVIENGSSSRMYKLFRFLSNGTLDPAFAVGSGSREYIGNLALQPNGKILICGLFNIFNDYTSYHIVRLNADGSVDTNYQAGNKAFLNEIIDQMVPQTNGKVLIVGRFQEIGGQASNGLVQLNADGGLDTGFRLSDNESERVGAIALQSDGTLFVSTTGKLTKYLSPYQTIEFPPLTDRFANNPLLTLQATSSANLPILFTVVSGPATVSGNLLTLTGTGQVTVRASQGGNQHYNAASAVERTFTVNKANQTIVFAAIGLKTFGDAPFSLSATASSGLEIIFSVVSGPATISGNTITLTGAGMVKVDALQVGNADYLPTLAEQTFVVNAVLAVEKPGSEEIEVFPNPASVALQVRLPLAFQEASLVLLNLQGQTMLQQSVQSQREVTVVLPPLPQGLYLLQIGNDRQLITRKIRVQ